MTGRSGQIEARGFASFARAMFAACATLLVASALAQESRPPADIPTQKGGEGAANPPPASVPDPQRRPGLVDAIGGWLGDSTTRFRLDLKDAQQTFDQLTDQTREAAKDATGAVIGVPNMRIMPVHERTGVVTVQWWQGLSRSPPAALAARTALLSPGCRPVSPA